MKDLVTSNKSSVHQLLAQVAFSSEQMSPRKRIVDGITRLIEEKRLPPESALPTSREMMELFGVSIATVQAAMDELVRENLLSRTPRQGTFVKHPPSANSGKIQATKKVCVFDGVDLKDKKSGYMGRCYLSAILESARNNNYEVVLETASILKSEPDEKELIRWREMSAVILPSPSQVAIDRAQLLAEDGIPVLLFNAHSEHPKIGCVYTDNIAGSYEATAKLIQLGHERICFLLPTSQEMHVSYSERLEGCRRALAEANLSDPIIVEWQQTEALSAALCRDNKKHATAILDVGVGYPALFNVLGLLGLSVPEDISVVSYDHALMATDDGKTIAAIEQPIEDMVERAFSLIPTLQAGGFSLRLPQAFYDGGTIAPVNI